MTVQQWNRKNVEMGYSETTNTVEQGDDNEQLKNVSSSALKRIQS